jgi:ABC-2 type transport system permease protein
MRKVLIIIQREYLTRVKRVSFIVTTLLAPIGFIVFMLATVLVTTLSSDEKRIAVIDESGVFKETRFPDADNKSLYFSYPESNFDTLYSRLNAEGTEAQYDAILRIPQGFDVLNPNRVGIQLFTADRPGLSMKQFLSKTINDLIRKKKLEVSAIDPEVINNLNEDVRINYISGLGNEKAGFTEVAAILGYLIGFIIYIALFVYGTMTMKGVMEEKTNRIVEVLVSSVKPFQLMLGKIIGIGAVGLTQFVLWVVLIFLSNLLLGVVLGVTIGNNMQPPSGMGMQGEVDLDDVQMIMNHLSEIQFLPLILCFLFFFIGGFLLYGALFAAVGAATSDDGDMQSLTFPISLPIIISALILTNVIGNPGGKLALWASLIPFSSPLIMPALMPFDPPIWQLILSGVFLICGFLFTTWIAARIYRTGILMYGKKVTLKELGKWLFKST